MWWVLLVLLQGVAGQPFPDFFVNGTSLLYQPGDASADPTNGDLYVADQNANRVVRFIEQNNTFIVAGVLGQPNYMSTGPTAASVHVPYGVHVDQQGNLWVADSGHNRVLRFSATSKLLNGSAADGVLGQPNFTVSAYGRSSTIVSTPISVFVDPEGNLWVSDYGNNRVLRWSNATFQPNGAPADSVLGQTDFLSDQTGCCQTCMNQPNAVAATSVGLLVADQNNNRIVSTTLF